MSRFLTPAKIALLALASVYVEGNVPTSHSVAVLNFLVTYIIGNARPAKQRGGAEYDPTLSLSTFEKTLSPLASVMPGRSAYDAFLKTLWMIDCSYSLDEFMETMPNYLRRSREQIIRDREYSIPELENARILRTSPLGAFIRRCHLEYTRLQFQDAVELWQQLIAYRAPSHMQFERKNPAFQRHMLDNNLTELGVDSSHLLAHIMYRDQLSGEGTSQAYSAHDVEKLLEFQVSEMQCFGSRLPEGMLQTLGRMSEMGNTTPKLVHYLKFLDSWRAGDYTSAFDNLHRYFDYTMQSRDRTFYQYALLNLAILQADFGCSAEAIPAMQEAIATARENKDTTCLNFCMSWLYHFGRTFPSEMRAIQESGILGNETEGLAFLKSRARDAEMWSLLSTSLLSEAKLALQHGGSLATVFESITKAAHINISKATSNITGPTLLMRASAFSRIGLSSLAWSCSETFLACYAADAPVEDILKCTCRMASFLAQRGRYSAIADTLATVPASTLRILKHNNYWTFYSGLLKLRRLIRHDDLSAAQYVASQLQSQDAPDLEISTSLAFLRVELLLAQSKHASALDLVEDLADKTTSDNNDVIIICRLFNLKARILFASHEPLGAFSIVIRAAQLAYRALQLPPLWESIGLLAHILNHLREFKAAIDLLNAILPRVLECHDCELAGATYGYLADAEIGFAGTFQETKDQTRRKELVNRAMAHLEAASAQYGFAEHVKGQLDCLYKRAWVLRWQGDAVLADDMASQWLEVKNKFEAMRL
jgi:anaphase-promoting complex subunit 5